MKLVQATIDPARLVDVQEALSAVDVFRLTVSDVTGLARPSEGPGMTFDSRPQVRLDVAVNESFLRPTLEAIFSAAREETPGRILVLPLTDVIRIRTGERGPEAI